jgi:hypothetical protein
MAALTALYGVLRLYVNFFQPSAKLLSKERKEGRTTKRYDKAQTPYQRILSSTAVGEDEKTQLRASYERLDPAVILKQVEHLQDRFWEHAHKKGIPNKDIKFACALIEQNPNPSNLVVTTPALGAEADTETRKTVRAYRRTRKPSLPRTWRTRADPFAEVWGEIQLQFEIDPSRSAKELFLDLQQRYPGKHPHCQLRTLQRRVQRRRREQLYSSQSLQAALSLMPAVQGEGEKL